jgi:hypothetical protein
MHTTRFVLAAAFVFAANGPISAQVPDSARFPGVDVAIEQIISGGRWQSGKATGEYRIIVVREGWEEIRRRVVLEWLQEGDRDVGVSRRQAVELNDRVNIYGLSDPQIVHRGSRWILLLKAATQPLSPYNRVVAFELGAPGQITRVRRP